MKRLSVLTICCFSMAAQAGFNMRVPLELKENGRLPDGSIVFINGTGPTTPTTPDEGEQSNCKGDLAGGTYYMVQTATGETLDTKIYNGSQISNGSKGKLYDSQYAEYGIYLYELCMNGQSPQPYTPPIAEEYWPDGSCKYNTLGSEQSRFWVEAKEGGVGQDMFLNSSLGDYGYISFNSSNMSFLNFGNLYNYGRLVNSNSKIVYDGYTYYKGKYVRTSPAGYSYSENGGPTYTSDAYYYEVCRKK